MGSPYLGPRATSPSDVLVLADITALKAGLMGYVKVVTGNEPRPEGFATVWWDGGSTRPVNMQNGDKWLTTTPQSLPVAPSFVTTTLNSMVVGTAFTQTLVVNGTPTPTLTVTSGALPSWMTLNNGTLAGTPNASGAYDFTLTATNSAGSVTQRYQGTVSASGTAPTWVTSTLPAMTQNSPYNSGAMTVNGTTPMTYGVVSGLPAGLSINSSTGAISGTPTVSGAYTLVISASNGIGSPVNRTFTGTITAAGVTNKSLFAAASPGTSTVGNDGGGTLVYGNAFYSVAALPVYTVRGLRLWRPAGQTAFAAAGGVAYGQAVSWPNITPPIPLPTVAGAQQSKSFGAGTAGQWQDILFDNPIVMHNATSAVDGNDVIWLSVALAGGQLYNIVAGLATSPVQASNGDGLYLAESAGYRGWNNLGGTVSTYYGIDVLYTVG